MLRLPPFHYLAPRTLDAAVSALAEHGPEAMLVAGGTDLYPNLKRRQFEPKVLVGLRAVGELNQIARDEAGGLSLGAGLTLTRLSQHPLVAGAYPALAQAAGLVSTAQLRNMGTLGGNLCLDTRCTYYNQTYHWRKSIGFCMKKDGDICLVAPGSPRCWAVSSSDTAPVMIALGARLRLVGPAGERVIPAEAFYRDDGMQFLAKAPEEILAGIHLPPPDGLRTAYLKLRRRGAFDFPLLGVAVALRLAADGTISHARIVLGAVHSYPVEAVQAARLLLGQRPAPDLFAAAANLAAAVAKPLDNTDMLLSYRKKMVPVYVTRALHAACS